MKPFVCGGCHAAVYTEGYERREEIIPVDRDGRRLGVKRMELLCRDCALGLAGHWRGFNPRQGAMFPVERED